MTRWALTMAIFSFFGTAAGAEDGKSAISLPAPQVAGGKTLNEALCNRKTTRGFASKKLDAQMLSNLLWSANGRNREDGRRTAPTAKNAQEIVLYLLLEEGVYRYEPDQHKLTQVKTGDHRELAGLQEYTHAAPVTVIYVAELAKMDFTPSQEDRRFYATVDCGFIGQNIYLFAAANDLATVFRGSIDRAALAQCFGLQADQLVLFAQSVGYPQ